MRNLINDPTFVNRANYWLNLAGGIAGGEAEAGYLSSLWDVTDGVATITADPFSYIGTSVLGKAGAPAAGDDLAVSVQVSSTSPVTVAVLQGGAVIGSATQAAATSTLTEVAFSVTASSAFTLSLRVSAANEMHTLRLASPAIMAPDTEPDPDPDPDPEPEPDPLTALAAALAPRVAAYLGSPTYAEQAEAALPVVVEFVKGYVRDRGFGADGYSPEPGLRAVIVSAASRLVANPEQAASYQSSDYSERPAVFTGYTLAEIGVLHRYRRRAW